MIMRLKKTEKKINQGGQIEVQHTHKIHIKSGTY